MSIQQNDSAVRRLAVTIHLMIWVYIFVSPIAFFWRENEAMTLEAVLHRIYFPVASCAMFYLNYFVFIPKYYLQHRIRQFIVVNLVLILLFTTLHEVLVMMMPLPRWRPDHMPPPHGNKPPGPMGMGGPPGLFENLVLPESIWNGRVKPMFVLRDMISMTFIALLSLTVKLCLRWHDNEKARQKAELARSEAELKNLKNQMNPHFLLNTLNNIYALTELDGEKARKAISELSVLLRHVLYVDQTHLIPLRKELNFLRTYIELMRIRVSDRVDIRFTEDVKDEENIQVAPLILISLVENAFKHGISARHRSFLHFSIRADRDHLCFSSENSNFPKTETDKSPGGIGLQQVEARLRHFYSGRYTWTYGPTEDGSTFRSVIRIEPLTQERL